MVMKIRKLIFLLLLSICSLHMPAQEVVKNELPKDIKGCRMNFQMDFSKALIYGFNEREFAESEPDWESDKLTVIRNFRVAVNLQIGKSYSIDAYKDAPYMITVIVNTITNQGFIICDVNITDQENNVVYRVENLSATKEPSFFPGTKLAKIKFWSTLTGQKLGSLLKNELDK